MFEIFHLWEICLECLAYHFCQNEYLYEHFLILICEQVLYPLLHV